MEENQNKSIQQIIKEEYVKCALSPEYFVRKYCYIQNPTKGRVIFNLYPFQSKVLDLWKDHSHSIILKSRQLGISTLAAGYALWLMLFHKDKNVLCLATKQETAKNMVTKVKFMFDNLPSWLKTQNKAEENNKLTLKLSNGSQIKAVSAAGDSGRSEAVSLLIIDEAAFIDGIETIWASAQQTVATGGRILILSTPNGSGNWFHRTWVKAESQSNEFLPIKLPWRMHPERDQKWRDKQDAELGPKLAAQECDCDFSTSGDTVFNSDLIKLLETKIKEPIAREGIDKNLWIWEFEDYSKNYMVVADSARGDGSDYSTAHVFELESNTQVAEFKSQLSTRDFGYFLVGLASKYNNALLVIENTSIGWAVLDAVEEKGYRNIYYSPKSDTSIPDSYFTGYNDQSNSTRGFTMSLKTRPLVVNKGIEYLRDGSVNINSKRTLEEIKVFIWKNGRPEAQSGYNDDLVIPYCIAMYLRDTALKYKQQGLEMTKVMINNIQKTNYQQNGHFYRNGVSNPYSMNINGQNEDIRWLF